MGVAPAIMAAIPALVGFGALRQASRANMPDIARATAGYTACAYWPMATRQSMHWTNLPAIHRR